MVPSAFVRLDGLPLTPNGKLDRQALPAPDDDAYARTAYEAPQGAVETALAEIWQELLGVERVGRHDNFFELGGHSLLAVQLMERLRRLSLGVEVRTLFARPVLADLAASLGSHHEVAVPANLITEHSTAITPQMLPLIELAQPEIDRIVATFPAARQHPGHLWPVAAAGRHPVPSSAGQPGDPYLLVSQMALPTVACWSAILARFSRWWIGTTSCARLCLGGLSSPPRLSGARRPWMCSRSSWRAVMVRYRAAEAPVRSTRQRIDLGRAPLLRFVIAREPGSGRWLQLQLLHHLIGDHTTLEVMDAEVRAVLDGRAHELAAPQPFRNLVAQARLGVDAKAHEAFFREMLADIDEPTMPFGLSEVRGDGSGSREARRMLPQALNDRLRQQARRLGVSLASLCHLAWGQVVALSSGREQVVFGTVLFGRMHAGAGSSRASDLGLKFSTADLFQAPVLTDFATKIHLGPQLSNPGVISVQATGSQPPLFFVPTGLGDCSYVPSLVKEMDVDCPVYALPWPSFDEVRPPTLEAIAAEIIVAIREIQPRGPYRLAGYSSGGILAYAIAQRLLSLDDAVSFIALIDVTLPANPSSISPTQMIREVVLDSFESLDDESFEALERFTRQSSIAQLLEKAQQIGAIPLDHDLQNVVLMYEKSAQFHAALQSYRVPSLPIEVHQFYATEPLISRRVPPDEASIGPEASSPMRGWDRVLGAAAIHAVPIPGRHDTLMSVPQNRVVLARAISRALGGVDSRRT
ncbi:hypothetical protein BMW22_38695 (plasmid) [Rhizobium leguminosarum]|uniref:Carrier domain-containing protein n=1 Tax=Rhizobium leguminosarum TaxID=384 RepID=A0A1L3ZPE7_RHILE|nr:hypothetical protein BMW22_38695 [Rhizobium leguminosarum]